MINSQYKTKIEKATNLINNKKLDDALDILKELIINFPNDFFLENFYAAILLNKKDFHNAEKFLKKSIKNNEEFASSYFNLGILYYETRKYNEAINNFSKSLEIQPGFLQAIYFTAISYQFLNLQDNAIKFFLRFIDLDSNNINVYSNMYRKGCPFYLKFAIV
jgi:tetratricopeptide (TPR) repeat protein